MTPDGNRAGDFRRAFARFLRLAAMTVIGAVAGSLVLGAPPAAAHTSLLFTTPAFDSTVADVPKSLTLFFNDPVELTRTPVQLAGPDGDVAVGRAVLSEKDRGVEVPVLGTGGDGIYTVSWKITAEDGEVMAGSFRFAVGLSGAKLAGGSESSAQAPWAGGVLRGLLFAALAIVLGEHAGRRFIREAPGEPSRPRPWTPMISFLGLGASLGSALILAGEGSLVNGLIRPAFGALVSTTPGILALVEVSGFALAVVLTLLRKGRWAWLPMTAVVIAEALRAHPGIETGGLGTTLTALHLTSAVLWVGTLVYALRTAVALRRQPSAARTALAAYARLAVWLIAIVVLTGFGTALLLVPVDEVLTTDYGRALVAKIIVVAAAGVFALIARRRLRRGAAPRRIRRPALVEVGALFAVLGMSAALTVLPMPGSADASLSFPPPVTGPFAPAAALAGQVGVNVRASEGQLIANVAAPDVGRTEPFTEEDFALAGVLIDPSGARTELAFRGCGTGCFFTPVEWQDGSNRLILSPQAEGWTSADAGMSVEWPVVAADELLAEAVSATRAMPSLTLYERVTSNPKEGLGAVTAHETSGEAHVELALYRSGVATAAVRLPADGEGRRRIALWYPDESAVIELVLDDDGRIVRETLTAPHHLVTLTLVYG